MKRYNKGGRIFFDDYVACCVKLRALTGTEHTTRIGVAQKRPDVFSEQTALCRCMLLMWSAGILCSAQRTNLQRKMLRNRFSFLFFFFFFLETWPFCTVTVYSFCCRQLQAERYHAAGIGYLPVRWCKSHFLSSSHSCRWVSAWDWSFHIYPPQSDCMKITGPEPYVSPSKRQEPLKLPIHL